jgi:membrane dipeptidase
MLIPGWIRGKSTPEASGVRLTHYADHIDHICQLAGNARHVGFGTDLDGCFGTEQTPLDLKTIADAIKVSSILADRGYTASDVEAVEAGNFLRFLKTSWNKGV